MRSSTAPQGNSFDYTTNKHEITVYSTTYVFCNQSKCVRRFISSELHFSVFGTETISSDKRSIDISDTHLITLFC